LIDKLNRRSEVRMSESNYSPASGWRGKTSAAARVVAANRANALAPLKKAKRRAKHVTARVAIRLPHLASTELPSLNGLQPRVLVSLTSYPARIGSAWITIESILRQTDPPDEVLLVLCREEFPRGAIPKRLERMTRKGLRIMWVNENTRSYKKLLPALREHPDAVIVTADDDTIYPKSWLDSLLEGHRDRPNEILGHRGTEILVTNGGLAPYSTWPRASARTPSNKVFLTGMGGILYPPASLPDVALDHGLALRLCPSTDDIWFKIMALLAGTAVGKLSRGDGDFPAGRATQATALWHHNVTHGRNDEQFARALDHFGLWSALTADC
jgi:hypothetical protein